MTSAAGQAPSALLNTDFDGPMNTYAWDAYRDVAEKIAVEVMADERRSNFIQCEPSAAGCLRETIVKFGRRAFRRPLTDAEIARFERLGDVTPVGTPEEIAETTLFAFLASPSFIMLPELVEAQESGAFQLSSHEIATRLAMTLWGTIPDEELNVAADGDALRTREQILAHAERMVAARDKAGSRVALLHRDYLQMDSSSHWWKIQQNPELFPLATSAATITMEAELDAFFEDVAYSGGSFKDLFLSNTAFVNRDTAPIYGLEASDYGLELTRVTLDPEERPGFLTRAGFLSSFSGPTQTSPILRGAFITVKIIGVDPGAPDPSALQTPPPEGEFATVRAYTEALTDKPSCRGCHQQFVNPPGFVLESYDALGTWQTIDRRGGEIDATAEVVFSPDNIQQITSPRQMMEEIGRTEKARRIYAEKIVSSATGRLPNTNDACLVDELNQRLSADGYTVLSLLADLTQADSFRLRMRGN